MRSSVSASVAAVLVLSAWSAPPASAHPGSGIVVDEKGQVFFTDTGYPGKSPGFLWKVDDKGKLTRFHQGGAHWLALDAKDTYPGEDLQKWFQSRITMNFERVPLPDSKAALLQADGAPFVVGRDGNLYWAKGNVEIARLSPDGKVILLAAGLKETAEKLGGITGLATGPDGSLYLACNSGVLKVKMDGTFTKFADPVEVKDCDVDFPDNNPKFPMPALRGLAVDSQGTVYAAATGCHRVVKITPEGKVETVLKAERPWSPTGVAVRGEDIYVLEYTNATKGHDKGWLPRVRKLGRDGKITILATIGRDRKEPGP